MIRHSQEIPHSFQRHARLGTNELRTSASLLETICNPIQSVRSQANPLRLREPAEACVNELLQ